MEGGQEGRCEGGGVGGERGETAGGEKEVEPAQTGMASTLLNSTSAVHPFCPRYTHTHTHTHAHVLPPLGPQDALLETKLKSEQGK